MKKTLILAVCLCLVMGGCSKNKDNSNSNVQTSAQAQQSKEYEEKIAALEKQVDTLTNITALNFGVSKEDIESGNFSEIDLNGEFHAIYDDTAVVEAYKSGDDSKLTDEKDKYILTELKKAIDKIIKDDMSEYEKEKAVYDYMFEYTKFDKSSLAAISNEENKYPHTPYGFFHNRSVICVGNATTFKLFMDVLDIDCKIIHSTENSEHAWNVVKINDKWYQLDVTFDGGTKGPDYAYFNVPDSAKKYGDYPWETKDYPECTSADDSPTYKNAKEIKDIYSLPSLIASNIKAKNYKFSGKIKLDKNADEQQALTQIDDILSNINSNSEIYVSRSSSYVYDGYVVFNMNYSNFSDTEIPQEPKENKINAGFSLDPQKLSEAFRKQFKDESFTYGSDLENDEASNREKYGK